jgi:hypothetical protein
MEDIKKEIVQDVQKEITATKKRGCGKYVFLTMLVLLLLGAGLVWWFYYNSKSDGTRTVYLVKISHKGNIFKTYEGEALVSIGASPQTSITADKFIYSVTSPSLYDSLTKYEGQKLTLEYRQYRKTLPWRGDSEYIVTGFKKPAF